MDLFFVCVLKSSTTLFSPCPDTVKEHYEKVFSKGDEFERDRK